MKQLKYELPYRKQGGQMNRIEGKANRVLAIIRMMEKHSTKQGWTHILHHAFFQNVAMEIDDYYSQLFPQPLDGKELEKEIVGSIDKVLISYETMLACQVKEKFIESRELIKQRGAKLILALLPDIEEAKREERERIFKEIESHMQDMTGTLGNPEGNKFIVISERKWQALSGKGEK